MTLLDLFGHLATIPNPAISNTEDSSTTNDVRNFFADWIPEYVEPTPIPSTAPLNLGFTYTVNSIADWNNLPSIVKPGDVVKITNNIPGKLTWRGSSPGLGTSGPYPDGTIEAPITIICAVGVWIDPNNPTGIDAGLDVVRARHINVVHVNVRNCRTGIRYITSGGSASQVAKIHYCETQNINEENIYVGSLGASGSNPSSYISVKYNNLHNGTGNTALGDGILVGTRTSSSFAWLDTTNNIDIGHNEVRNIRGTGINIIPGVFHVFVHHNAVHDIAGDQGGGITHYVPSDTYLTDPTPLVARSVWIHSNWIWNIGYAFNNISGLAMGIRANLPNMLIYNNVIWSCAVKGGGNTRGIDANVYTDVNNFATIYFNNTIWVDDAITNTVVAGADDFFFFENLTADGSLGQGTATLANDFVGPIPTLNPTTPSGTSSTADSGLGPGSGFILKTGSGHINTVVTTDSHRTTDITGISVPRFGIADRGAYETLNLDFIPAPVAPTFNAGSAITLGLTDNIAAIVAVNPTDQHYQLVSGTYSTPGWNDVRVKRRNVFRAPLSGTAVLEGTGKTYCARAIDATGSSDFVSFIGPPGSIVVQNYGAGANPRAEYGAITAQPSNTAPGSPEYIYGTATGWFIQGIDFIKNGGGGLRVSDDYVVHNCTFDGHKISGMASDFNTGGLTHSCTFNANGLDPATGIGSNGANFKMTFHSSTRARLAILAGGLNRPKKKTILANCTFNATKAGITGDTEIGLWCDLACQDIEIYDTVFNNHPWSGVMIEGSNNIFIKRVTVNNSDGYGLQSEDFIAGAITIAESQNVTLEDFVVNDSVRALILRQSNRSLDWFRPTQVPDDFVNYAYPPELGGPRYWITHTATPIPGITDDASMWLAKIKVIRGDFNNCERIIISEGTDTASMTTTNSIPLSTIEFIDNNYDGSSVIIAGGFYDRSDTGISRTAWQALPYKRDN
jgi:hypothetical protein